MHANLLRRCLLAWASACAFAASLALASTPARAGTADDCARCHTDCEAQRKDPQAKKPCLEVDTVALARSEHRGMVCVDCHAKTFGDDPHPKARRADCVDCHVVNEGGKGVAFADIIDGFQKSAHALKDDKFHCVQCHEPHTFRIETIRNRAFDYNRVCLRCHSSEQVFQQLVHKSPPNLDKAHEWLPNRDLHWSVIRCLDCHTGSEAAAGAHLILPKTQALKRCEACHSAKPVRLLRLYTRMREKEVQRLGFITAAFVNDAYVVGATRNGTMDLFAILIMGATAGGILGHGGLRLLAGWWMKRRRSHGGEPHR